MIQERSVLAGMCLTGFLAATALGFVVLHHFPNSGDELCYLLQANIFSQGKMSVASPPQREFFDVGWMINNGKFYTQHSPGWPLVLAIGVLAGVPWLVNPLLGALTLLVIYRLGKHMYEDTRIAVVATLSTLSSPFFLFHSASYWAHSSSLLALTFSLLGFVKGVHNASPRALILGGLSGSLSLLIRPLEQLALLAACGLFCLLPDVRRRYGLKAGVGFLGLHLVGVILLLGYHTLQHGHPLVTGYQLGYSASGAANIQLTLPTWHYIDNYLADLLLWTAPGLPLAAAGYLVCLLRRRGQRPCERQWDYLLLGFCVAGIGLYTLVAYPSLIGYGPRYYYSLLGAVALLAARGCCAFMDVMARQLPAQWRRQSAVIGMSCFFMTLGAMYAKHLTHEAGQLQQRMAFQRLITAKTLRNAVVFIRASSGDFDPKDLTRNQLDFQGNIVYALDLGDKNTTLMEHYPGRRYYLYRYDETQSRPDLQEIRP